MVLCISIFGLFSWIYCDIDRGSEWCETFIVSSPLLRCVKFMVAAFFIFIFGLGSLEHRWRWSLWWVVWAFCLCWLRFTFLLPMFPFTALHYSPFCCVVFFRLLGLVFWIEGEPVFFVLSLLITLSIASFSRLCVFIFGPQRSLVFGCVFGFDFAVVCRGVLVSGTSCVDSTFFVVSTNLH